MIIINVTKNEATVVQTEKLTSGTRGLKCKFNFSEEWDSLEKIAVCSCGNVTKDVFVESDTIVVPWEVMEVYGKYLEIGVYGRSSDDTVIIPTVYATVGAVCKGADPSGDESSAPTPSLWDKYVKDSEKFTKEYAYSKKETDDKLTKYATKKDVSTGYVSKNAFEKEMNTTKTEIHNTFSGALKGSVVGKNIVSMKDVSPIEHKIDVQVTSDNIPLYPYDTDADNIAGCPYTITDDGVYEISGVSEGGEGYAIIKTMTLSPGSYTFKLEGADDYLYGMLIDGDEFIVGETSPIYGFWDDMPFVYELSEEKTVSLILKWLLEPEGKTYSWRIKPYLSRGTEIAPEVSKAKLYKTGKNLFRYPNVNTLTRNGITFTANADGTISAKGTATAEAVFTLASKFWLGSGTYAISGCPVGGGFNKTYWLELYPTDGSGGLRDVGRGATKTLTTPQNVGIYIYVMSGQTVDLVFKPQIELGNVTGYEPYISPTEVDPNNVTSLCPTTTLYTDTVGVKIEATYNRDITKAYAELQKRIETLEALLLDATTN
jgi:hypothetical protein